MNNNLNKVNSFLKNVLVFLAIFLIVNYVMQLLFTPDKEPVSTSGNVIFKTNDSEYNENGNVEVLINNNSADTITIPNECPKEPFDVFHYENNQWVQKTAKPNISCANPEDVTLNPGEKITVTYNEWKHALFSETGRYKIEYTTELNGKETTLSTNEFEIRKPGIFSQLWRGLFYKPIYNALIYLTYILPGHSLGLAIILLTIIIRTILLIPSQKAMESQKRMQEIQPKLEEIKTKYKGDQQRIAMETMAIWKEAKVKPMGSCLPLLLQFPFLIAIFYVIQDGLNPDNTYLLYSQLQNFTIQDISINFLGLDLTKINIYVLPLIIGALQYLQMKMAMSSAKNKKTNQPKELAMASNMMLYMMPIMIAVFTATLPSGVGLYWGTSTIYGIIQQYFVNKKKADNTEPKVRVIEP